MDMILNDRLLLHEIHAIPSSSLRLQTLCDEAAVTPLAIYPLLPRRNSHRD
jgi:hypothetical protein